MDATLKDQIEWLIPCDLEGQCLKRQMLGKIRGLR